MPFLSSRAKVILTAGVALGFSIYQLTCIAVADYADQAANSPRPLPSYNGGNPEGYNTARPFRDHGPPGWASVNSPIDPPLSDEEFRSHFGFAAHLILAVHKTYRPGADGYNGLLQRAFYSGDKKAHGLVFEMILFPDGMVGRAFGPVEGRRHDLYLARVSRLLALITHGALQGFRLFGDKAYIGFGANILHPFIGAAVGSIEAEWNEYTSGYRIEVEHVIGNIYSRWACLQHEQGIEMHLPEVWFQASVLMNNIHVCATRSSQTALRWAMPILPLRKYMEP